MSDTVEASPFYFDDCIVGAEHPAASYTVSAEEIIAFAKKWDPQPWHIDESLAKASLFAGLTCCSAHIFSIFCSISQQWQSGVQHQMLAGLGFDEMRMQRPVYAGDTLRSVSTIEAIRASRSKRDRGVVTQSVVLWNQHDEQVFSVKATSMMARDPARIG